MFRVRVLAPLGLVFVLSISSASSAPNILLIIADDMGLDASPCYDVGAVKPDMPVLTQLCRDGVVFDNVWSAPVCSPTRATILTGRYGFRTGVLDRITRNAGQGIATSELSIQRLLAEHVPAPYANAVIGKWHLSDNDNGAADNPARMGVAHYTGLLQGGGPYTGWRRTTDGVTAVEEGYATTVLTDAAISWIGQRDTAPWFLWLAYTAPHTPFHLPPKALIGDTDWPADAAAIRANPLAYYMLALKALDREIGRLLGSLSSAASANTLIVFLGDNGSPAQAAQPPFSRRTVKGTLYEGGIRVPMVVAGAGVTRAGVREPALVNTTDLFATFAQAAGVEISMPTDSLSFLPLLTDGGADRRAYAYAEFRTTGRQGTLNSGWAIRDDRHKLIVLDNGRQMLFDLEADFSEQRDLLREPGGDATANRLRNLAEKLRSSAN